MCQQRSSSRKRFKTTAAKIAHGYWHLPRAVEGFSFVDRSDDDSTNSAACRSVSKLMFVISKCFQLDGICFGLIYPLINILPLPCAFLPITTQTPTKLNQVVQERLMIDRPWSTSTNHNRVIVFTSSRPTHVANQCTYLGGWCWSREWLFLIFVNINYFFVKYRSDTKQQ